MNPAFAMEKRRSTEPVFTRFTVLRVIDWETPFAILLAGGILAGNLTRVIVQTVDPEKEMVPLSNLRAGRAHDSGYRCKTLSVRKAALWREPGFC